MDFNDFFLLFIASDFKNSQAKVLCSFVLHFCIFFKFSRNYNPTSALDRTIHRTKLNSRTLNEGVHNFHRLRGQLTALLAENQQISEPNLTPAALPHRPNQHGNLDESRGKFPGFPSTGGTARPGVNCN